MNDIVSYQAKCITEDVFYDDLVDTVLKTIRRLPKRTKEILSQADRLSSQRGKIRLAEPITSLDLLLLLSHKNACFITSIVPPKKLVFSYASYSKQAAKFQKLYETPPPIELFQIQHCLDQLNACLTKRVCWSNVIPTFDLDYGMNSNLFCSETLNEERLLEGRYPHHELSYHPIAINSFSPEVTYGMIFDNELRQFSNCAAENADPVTVSKSLWETLIENFSSEEAFTYIEPYDLPDEKASMALTYKNICDHINTKTHNGYDGGIFTWLLNFILPGYLENNKFEKFTLSTKSRKRYHWKYKMRQRYKNGEFIVLQDIYPKLTLPRVDAFSHLDAFVVQDVCDLMATFIGRESNEYLRGASKSKAHFDYFLESYKKLDGSGKQLVQEILGQDCVKCIVQRKETKMLIKRGLEQAVEFAIKENGAGRYGWAIHFGMIFWSACVPLHSNLAVSCLEVVDGQFLHPLIPRLAKIYNKTRVY